MKKIIAIFAALLICSVAILPAFAEQTDLATDTEAAETVPQTETEPLSETTPTTDPALWQEMLDYLAQNGVDTSDFGSDTVEKLIALGEQFADLKEQGYTLEERLEQLVTPENILTTASAAVLVFSTVFLFIMKSRQRTATLTAARQMQSLRSAYDTEAAENAALRTQVEELKREQQTMAELLRSVSETTALNAKELKTARDCSVGVANMVKDVFLNSRSLDHAGKDLMIRNYLNATAGVTEEAKEEAEA